MLGQQGSGTATKGVFTYFFWVLLQPFRGNPEYQDVADLPYNSTCLSEIPTAEADINTLSEFTKRTSLEETGKMTHVLARKWHFW